VGKHCSNSQCFKEKNYNAKFSISSILKKSTKIILEKKTNNNAFPIGFCFIVIIILNQLNIKKKSIKIILEKIIKKSCGETLQQFTVF
jgi:hypothetical protein